jgi:hypothetical protein
MDIRALPILLALLAPLSACTNFPGHDQEIVQRSVSAPSAGALLFAYGKTLIGVDPRSGAVRILLKFRTFIGNPSYAHDGRILVGDVGAKIGDFGGGFFVIGPKGRVEKKIPTLPNPVNVVDLGPCIFVDSLGYYENGNTAFSLFDAETFSLLSECKTLTGFVTSPKKGTYGEAAWLGVNPNVAAGTPGFVLRIDGTSKRAERFALPLRARGMSLFRSFIYGNKLYTSYGDDFVVEAYDLDTLRATMTVNLADLFPDVAELKPKDGERWGTGAIRFADCVGGKLILFVTDTNPAPRTVNALISIDPENPAAINRSDIRGLENHDVQLRYVTEDKAYFQEGETIFVVSLRTLQPEATIDIPR